MNKLDKDQQAAIEFDDALILAGPGSGKTRTLVSKAVSEHEKNRTVYIITFTVSAADEIQHRLDDDGRYVVGWGKPVYVSTLHSMCLDIMHDGEIKREIADDSMMEEIAREVKQSLRIKITDKRVKELLTYDDTLNRSRSEIVFCDAVTKLMNENGLVSYEGILKAGLWFLDKPGMRKRKGANVSYLIDEAQDSAPMDLKIYDVLHKSGAHLWMVGDLQQGIFGFRHKQKANVWEWWHEDPEEKLCHGYVRSLPANYRSSAAVVKALNLINQEFVPRVESIARPDSPAGDVTMNVTENEIDMLSSVAYKVNIWIEAKEYLNQIAVLCRTNAQSSTVASFLDSLGIRVRKRKKDAPTRVPARLWAALSLYIKPESDWRAMRWLLMDNERFHLEVVARKAAKEMKPLISFYHPSLLTSERGILMWPHWMDLLGIPKSEQAWFYERADFCAGIGHNQSWDEIMLRLFEVAVDPEEGNGVAVITIHAAKGREWNRVIVPYADSHTFGHKDKNEEERIFFVAASRAIESLAFYRTEELLDFYSGYHFPVEDCAGLERIKNNLK